MQYYLPTRDECQALTEKSEAFYCSTKTIEGQVVEMYDYRLAGYTDFFPEDGNNWTELRGLTFVQQADGSWERNILLQKFFNINQTTDWMYDDVKHKKIVRVQSKEDGSIISFVKFANGNIRAKSKMSFESPQAVMAQEIYDTDVNLKKFIDFCLVQSIYPTFELVSPSNQIVLEYTKTQLVLLQIRDYKGRYQPNPDLVATNYHIPFAETFPLKIQGLDRLLSLKGTSQDDIEGWVVTFEDGQMAKIKTDKYLQLHGLIGPDAMRENLLVATILDGNIDDVVSALVPGVKKDKIEEMTKKIEANFNHLVWEFIRLRDEYFNVYNEDRKAFALYAKKHPIFSGVMRSLHPNETTPERAAEQHVKEHILKKCKGLKDAQNYLKGL